MILYHGSNQIIKMPTYGLGNKNNDYGVGFYLTQDKTMANIWASKNLNDGYVNEYTLNLNGLSILNLTTNTEKDILIWITILISHRFSFSEKEEKKEIINWLIKRFSVSIDDYDIIIGYRADDSCFAYSYGFVNDQLPLELLLEAMKLGKLGKQAALISKKAFNNLEFFDYEKIEKSSSYDSIRRQASIKYEILKRKRSINMAYMRDIIRKYEKN